MGGNTPQVGNTQYPVASQNDGGGRFFFSVPRAAGGTCPTSEVNMQLLPGDCRVGFGDCDLTDVGWTVHLNLRLYSLGADDELALIKSGHVSDFGIDYCLPDCNDADTCRYVAEVYTPKDDIPGQFTLQITPKVADSTPAPPACTNLLDQPGATRPWGDFVSCSDEQGACGNQVVKEGCHMTCSGCTPSNNSATNTANNTAANTTGFLRYGMSQGHGSGNMHGAWHGEHVRRMQDVLRL